MKYFQETTKWNDNPKAVNHIYYMNDEKSSAVGYIQFGVGDLIKFKSPMKLDMRGRKFVELKTKGEPDSVYFQKVEEKPKNIITVQGSNGKEYYIEKVGNRYTCTCPGFVFRSKCKHVENLK